MSGVGTLCAIAHYRASLLFLRRANFQMFLVRIKQFFWSIVLYKINDFAFWGNIRWSKFICQKSRIWWSGYRDEKDWGPFFVLSLLFLVGSLTVLFRLQNWTNWNRYVNWSIIIFRRTFYVYHMDCILYETTCYWKFIFRR